MPAYNFKKRFAAKVESGEKLHTIRAKRKDGRRPKPEQAMHGYTGLRTKYTRLLVTATISKVEGISITAGPPAIEVWIDGRKLTSSEIYDLAIADGFVSSSEFLAFFRDEHGLPFVGDLIHWRFQQ
jgi:hypothetical protein